MKDTSLKTVGGDRRVDAVSVEKPKNTYGSIGRDTRYKSGVGRDIDNSNRAQGKGWIRFGNDRQELSSNPTAAHWIK